MHSSQGLVLFIDPDPLEAERWLFRLTRDGTPVPDGVGQLRRFPDHRIVPEGQYSSAFPTAALLVRAAADRGPISYDFPVPPPETPPPRQHRPPGRVTAGRSKATGETLAARAARATSTSPDQNQSR